MIRGIQHFVYGAGIMPGVNGWGPDTALWHELQHELGERVEYALESENVMGWSALHDLLLDKYMQEHPGGPVDDES